MDRLPSAAIGHIGGEDCAEFGEFFPVENEIECGRYVFDVGLVFGFAGRGKNKSEEEAEETEEGGGGGEDLKTHPLFQYSVGEND